MEKRNAYIYKYIYIESLIYRNVLKVFFINNGVYRKSQKIYLKNEKNKQTTKPAFPYSNQFTDRFSK